MNKVIINNYILYDCRPGYNRPAPKPAFSVSPAIQRDIAREIEKKASELGGGNNSDAEANAPFNFQGMLRKTNYARDSMKRRVSVEGSVVYNSRNHSPQPYGTSYDPLRRHSTGTTLQDVVPGLVLEGEAVDL